eukprot:2024761-Pleurochrysis_carterae.AAC.1
MLACGVPWSAKDYVIYSPTHNRSPCTKPLLYFEVGYPVQVPPGYTDWLPTHHRPTYQPTTIPTLNNASSANIILANLSSAGDCFDIYFVELILL